MDSDQQKKAAARRALDYVEHGMTLGLGTGSTAAHFVDAVGDRVAGGLDVLCVPTSEATRQHAGHRGIALTTLDDTPALDLTVDGADEIGRGLALIKGGGGALLREKIVAAASKRMVVIADSSKKVDVLGAFPLPVEVVRFGSKATALAIEAAASAAGLSGKLFLRTDREGETFITDNGNLIYDCHFGGIPAPERLAAALAAIPGVVEHGLFVGLASIAVIAGPDGIEVVESPSR